MLNPVYSHTTLNTPDFVFMMLSLPLQEYIFIWTDIFDLTITTSIFPLKKVTMDHVHAGIFTF